LLKACYCPIVERFSLGFKHLSSGVICQPDSSQTILDPRLSDLEGLDPRSSGAQFILPLNGTSDTFVHRFHNLGFLPRHIKNGHFVQQPGQLIARLRILTEVNNLPILYFALSIFSAFSTPLSKTDWLAKICQGHETESRITHRPKKKPGGG